MKQTSVAVLLLIAIFTAHGQKKRIYIANDDHIDYLWSADEKTYRHAFVKMLDYYVRKADSTIAIGLPSNFQSRFNCDGSLWLWTYEQNKTPQQFNSVISKVRSGHITVPFNLVNNCYGGMPAEAAIRSMYYAGDLERRFNIDIDLALAMEHVTLPLGVASLWAGTGAKYSWKGICACNTPFGRGNPTERAPEIYRYTGLDGRSVIMKWYSLNDTIPPAGRDKNQSLGGYSEARNPSYAVAACRKKFEDPDYSQFQVAGAFGYGWDDVQTYSADDFINAARQNSDPKYEVIVSNELDFFRDVEKTHGRILPALTATYGNERDLLCASLAETSAKVKRSLETLRSAEAMAALVSVHQPDFGTALDSARMKAWIGYGLYWEHDWSVLGGISPSSTRAAWERKVQAQISAYSEMLYDSARTSLGRQIRKTGTNDRFFVFNSLSWTRTDYADFVFPGSGPVKVIDVASGKEVPSQKIVRHDVQYLRILASGIPSVGYKIFEVQSGKSIPMKNAATVSAGNAVIENEFFLLTINASGVIKSLREKGDQNREYIAGEGANNLGSTAGTGKITVENSGPVSVTLRAVSTDPLAHTTLVTLYKGIRRIDIENRITENFSDVRQWTFGFRIEAPETWHEEVGAILKAKLTTDGGHYAASNALYKYLTLNHFASVNGTGYGVTISNRDCYFMQLGNSTQRFLDSTSPVVHVLAGGRVSNPELGIAGQDGDREFTQCFSVRTHGIFDVASEMRFALEHQNPFATGPVIGDRGVLPDAEYNFVKITDTNVVLWSLKPAEEGYRNGGIIARSWNFGDRASTATVSTGRLLVAAYETSHVETDLKPVKFSGRNVSTVLPPHGMATYRLKFK